MARAPKTRRAISVSGLTYQRTRLYCAAESRSMSGLVEKLLNSYLDQKGEPRPEMLRPFDTLPATPKLAGDSTWSASQRNHDKLRRLCKDLRNQVNRPRRHSWYFDDASNLTKCHNCGRLPTDRVPCTPRTEPTISRKAALELLNALALDVPEGA